MSERTIRLLERVPIFTITGYSDGMIVINDEDLDEGYPDLVKLTRIIKMVRSLADAMEEGRAMPGPPP